jgi:hypothetical protein
MIVKVERILERVPQGVNHLWITHCLDPPHPVPLNVTIGIVQIRDIS